MKPDQLTQDLAMISRNAIDYIIQLERERAALTDAAELALQALYSVRTVITSDGVYDKINRDKHMTAVEALRKVRKIK